MSAGQIIISELGRKVILDAIVGNLRHQREDGAWEPYVDVDDPADVTLDGHFSLVDLAEAVAVALEVDVPDADEPTHEGWDREHFEVTGCDGSLHASNDCLNNWKASTS